jgi:hypothetical protein
MKFLQHTHPYVSVAVGDGHTPYDYDNDGKKNELGGCEVGAYC